ncbi:MAG TPA: hypothetical protein VFT71_06260, partial [Candidatus Nitrosocosmicus sp.]|nr:hypothetical protein [Candidatus Nitrosocosmicus sp.]
LLTGHSILSSVEYLTMKNAVNSILNSLPLYQSKSLECPYGDGNTAEKIIEVLKNGKLIPLSERITPRRIGYMEQTNSP